MSMRMADSTGALQVLAEGHAARDYQDERFSYVILSRGQRPATNAAAAGIHRSKQGEAEGPSLAYEPDIVVDDAARRARLAAQPALSADVQELLDAALAVGESDDDDASDADCVSQQQAHASSAAQEGGGVRLEEQHPLQSEEKLLGQQDIDLISADSTSLGASEPQAQQQLSPPDREAWAAAEADAEGGQHSADDATDEDTEVRRCACRLLRDAAWATMDHACVLACRIAYVTAAELTLPCVADAGCRGACQRTAVCCRLVTPHQSPTSAHQAHAH